MLEMKDALLCLNGFNFMPQSRDMGCTTDEWNDRPQTSEEIEELMKNKKEAALKREKALAYAFSNQVWLYYLIISGVLKIAVQLHLSPA